MDHLFVIRHGHYEHGTGGLTSIGGLQVGMILDAMRPVVDGQPNDVYLLSSTAPRAFQTAQIIAREFGIDEIDTDEELWTGGRDDLTQRELDHIDGLLVPHVSKRVVAITTHYEVVGSYPLHILRGLNHDGATPLRPDTGMAIHFDFGEMEYRRLPAERQPPGWESPVEIFSAAPEDH